MYKITDPEKSSQQSVQFDLELENGQNFLQYNIAKKAKLDENAVYEVSVINCRGEEWLMKFIPVYYRK